MKKKAIICAACSAHCTQVIDCICKGGTHYEGGAPVTFRPHWDNPGYNIVDLFGNVDHTNTTELDVFLCFDCQKSIRLLIEDEVILRLDLEEA